MNLVGRRSKQPKVEHREANLSISMSMPAELWHNAQGYAHNHLKDFNNIAILH